MGCLSATCWLPHLCCATALCWAAGLKEYPKYMLGGGYVVGGEVARALTDLHTHHVPLKFMPIEDATFAMWAMSMDLRYVHHPKFHISPDCCFKQQERCGRTTRCGGDGCGQPIYINLHFTVHVNVVPCRAAQEGG